MSYNDDEELNVGEFGEDTDNEEEILDDDNLDTPLEDDIISEEDSDDEEFLDGEFMSMNEDEY